MVPTGTNLLGLVKQDSFSPPASHGAPPGTSHGAGCDLRAANALELDLHVAVSGDRPTAILGASSMTRYGVGVVVRRRSPPGSTVTLSPRYRRSG